MQQRPGRGHRHQPGQTSLAGEVDQPLAKSEPGSCCQQQWDLYATHGENFSVWLFVAWMRMRWKDQTRLWLWLILSVVRRCLQFKQFGLRNAHIVYWFLLLSGTLLTLWHTDTRKWKQKALFFVSGHRLSSQVFVHVVVSLLIQSN